MPRPFPWLSRLPLIRRAVAGSVRSHFGRRDVELTFGVSASAAGRLLELLGTERVGTGVMVQRETLSRFLDQVAEAKDVPALCERLRKDRTNLTRVKARYLVSKEFPDLPLASLPNSVVIGTGELRISATTLEELCARMMMVVCAMGTDPLGFEALFEPPRPESDEAREARELREEIRKMDVEIELRGLRQNAKKPPRRSEGVEGAC